MAPTPPPVDVPLSALASASDDRIRRNVACINCRNSKVGNVEAEPTASVYVIYCALTTCVRCDVRPALSLASLVSGVPSFSSHVLSTSLINESPSEGEDSSDP